MYFILSKILYYLLLPLTWIFIVFVVALFSKNKLRRRRFFIAAPVMLYIFTNAFLFNQFAKRWDIPAYPATDTTKYSCVIVLGGFAGEDKNGKGHLTGVQIDLYKALNYIKPARCRIS